MKKRIISLIAIMILLALAGYSQTVYQKDRWGAKIFHMTETTI